MPVTVSLTVDPQGRVVAACDGAPLAAPVPLVELKRIERGPHLPGGESNPYRFDDAHRLGAQLFAALGGPALTARLDAAEDDTLYLVTDEAAAAVPWEYAYIPDDEFLVCRYPLLRLLPQARPAPPARPGPLNFVAFAADPLVDTRGRPLEGPKLDVDNELARIQAVLLAAGVDLTAQRLPPTRSRLQQGLQQGPAVLHLSCHGSVETIYEGDAARPVAVLHVEDANGRQVQLRGSQLAGLPPARGVLRLAVLSACQTAMAGQANGAASAAGRDDANLARALVLDGLPAAVGMQGAFPDPLSDDLAAALYRALLAGYGLGPALRQARLALRNHHYAVGLPVAYVAPGGDDPLPLQEGTPRVGNLRGRSRTSLPLALQPPQAFLGRAGALHELARTFRTGQEDAALEQTGHAVVTVVGGGGIGKSALAAAFAARFGWRWPGGVVGATLASRSSLNPQAVLLELLVPLAGPQAQTALAGAPADQIAGQLLAAVLERQPLLLVDNYESVLELLEQGEAGGDEARHAGELHRLLGQLAERGAQILLTSRRQPAGFAGEVVFPGPQHQLEGIDPDPGAQLFFVHSTRARGARDEHRGLARGLAAATGGHPLAIALLAGEFDESPEQSPESFLAGWAEELAAARRPGQAAHHATFEIVFRRTFDRLDAGAQERLVALAAFPAPFFAAGAALLWRSLAGQPVAEDPAEPEIAAVASRLGVYERRSLLRVDAHGADGTSATCRFDPVLQRTLRGRLAQASLERLAPGCAANARWLVFRFFDEMHRPSALAQLWLEELVAQAGGQPEGGRARYCWELGVLLRQFGRMQDSLAVLGAGEEAAQDDGIRARILHARAEVLQVQGDLTGALALWEECLALNTAPEEAGERGVNLHAMANVYETRGDLDRALGLYQASLAIQEQLGDIRGKSATLHAMANVYVTRGDLDRALGLNQASLAIQEQLGDIRGKSATLHQMANVYETRGDLDRALGLYQASLAIQEQLGDISGKSATLHAMANVYVTRGDLDRALGLYQDSLAIKEQLGDIRGKSATLHQMANVYETRGDLDRALGLYQDSLAIDEQLGDIRGKSATLHAMANVYVTRGDLDRALGLYQASLAIQEQLGDIRGKSATLHQMANVYETRGDLDRALGLYQASLAIQEQLGDIRGKSATLHQMANVYVTRGDLDRALGLYQASLAIQEQLGDIRGKSATLHAMANVYVTRGDLDQALGLYQDSLAIQEQLGDIRGKSATLHAMANVYVTRGDLDQALGLYQDSLAIQEQLGDIRGKSATLGMMANVAMAGGDWAAAEQMLGVALALAEKLEEPKSIAFKMVKLGQVAQARNDVTAARSRFQEGLAIFQRLGMPEAGQVRAMLARLDGAPPGAPPAQATPAQALLALVRAAREVPAGRMQAAALRQALAQAAAAPHFSPAQHALLARLGEAVATPGAGSLAQLATAAAPVLAELDAGAAVALLAALALLADAHEQPAQAAAWQDQAVARQRSAPVDRASQEHLSVLLFNQAGYLAAAGRLDEAVAALEEVVVLDERHGLADLASDRAALARMKRRRDGLPDEEEGDLPGALPPGLAAGLEAQWAQLPPAQRAELAEAAARFARLSPDEQQAYLAAQAQRNIDEQAAAVAEAVQQAALQGTAAELLPTLEEAAQGWAEGEADGSPYGQLAQFTRAAAALLAGAPVPPVPAAYVERFAALRQALRQ